MSAGTRATARATLLKLAPPVGVLAGVCVLAALGFWQLQRAAEKEAIKSAHDARRAEPPVAVGEALLDARVDEFRLGTVRGRFEPEHQILIDNRVFDGRPGFEVVTPLRVAGSRMRILVNRGWIPWQADRARLPEFETPDGEVRLTGLLKRPSDAFFTLEKSAPDASQRVWQNLDLERYAALRPFPVQTMVLLLAPDSGAGFAIRWPEYDDAWIDRHRGYAVQWFGLAAALLVVYLFAVARGRRA